MKDQSTAIGVLAITAALLAAVLLFVELPQTQAQISTAGGDYVMVTYPAQGGSDAVYVADTRAGLVGVFVYDNTARALRVAAVRPVGDAFMFR
jgi:hypothetical protein